MFLQHRGLGRRQQAVEAAQHGERQDDLAVLVALVGAAEQIADAPDEAGELGMGFGGHGWLSWRWDASLFALSILVHLKRGQERVVQVHLHFVFGRDALEAGIHEAHEVQAGKLPVGQRAEFVFLVGRGVVESVAAASSAISYATSRTCSGVMPSNRLNENLRLDE